MYTPFNIQVYIAAYCGTLAGITATIAAPTGRASANDYSRFASYAGQYAEIVDAHWDAVISMPPNEADLEMIQNMTTETWAELAPISTIAPQPVMWAAMAEAMVKVIQAAKTYLVSEDIVPPPTPGGWTSQTTWYHDAINGSDSNSGSELFPVKTIGCICQRLAVVNPVAYTVYTTSDGIAATDTVRFDPKFSTGSPSGRLATLRIVGPLTDLLMTGTLTAVTNNAPATNVRGTITEATLGAAHVGQIVRLTSGVGLGATAVILKDIGAGEVAITDFALDGSLYEPSPGDTFEISTLATIASSIAFAGLPARATTEFYNLTVEPSGGNFVALGGDGNGFVNCRIKADFGTISAPGGSSVFNGCAFVFASPTAFMRPIGAVTVSFLSCGFINASIFPSGPSTVLMQECIGQGGKIEFAPNGRRAGGFLLLQGQLGWFDGAASAVLLRRGARMSILATAGATGFYGSGNTNYGLDAKEGAQVDIHSGTVPTATGSSGDVRVDDAAVALQSLELSAGGPIPATVALTLWTQWDAAAIVGTSGFARNVMSYKTGTAIYNVA